MSTSVAPSASPRPTLSWVVRLIGTILFVVAALIAAGVIHGLANVESLALLAFACWLGSSLVA